MKGFIIRKLEEAQKEVRKRFSVKDTLGVDLANYENNFTSIFVDMIKEYFKYIGCKDSHMPYESLKEQIEMWLWEENYEIMFQDEPFWSSNYEKKAFKGTDSPIGYVINTEKPVDFYNYIFNWYTKDIKDIKDKKKSTYTLKEVRQLLELQKEQVVFSLHLSSRGFVLPKEINDVEKLLLNTNLVV
jgi:hypothetical protein